MIEVHPQEASPIERIAIEAAEPTEFSNLRAQIASRRVNVAAWPRLAYGSLPGGRGTHRRPDRRPGAGEAPAPMASAHSVEISCSGGGPLHNGSACGEPTELNQLPAIVI